MNNITFSYEIPLNNNKTTNKKKRIKYLYKITHK